MSLKENELWAEVAMQNFEQAIGEGNYSLCKDIIADTKDKGFEELAKDMRADLAGTPVSQFTIKSNVLWSKSE